MTEGRETIEKAVIGCILLDPVRGMDCVVNHEVAESWFDNVHYSRIFGAALKMHAEKGFADVVNLEARFKDQPATVEMLHAAFGSEYSIAFLPDYIDKLEWYKNYTEALKAAKHAQMMLERVEPLDSEASDVYGDIVDAFSSIGSDKKEEMTLEQATSILINRWRNPPPASSRIQWPTTALNMVLQSPTDELIYISAVPSVGKTAVALQMLYRNAINGRRCAIASLESSLIRLAPRLLGHHAGVNSLKAEKGKCTPDEIIKLAQAKEFIDKLPIEIASRSMTTDQLHSWAKLAVERGAEFIIVDNTKHIDVKKSTGDLVKDFTFRSKELLRLRNDVHVPIIAIHHSTQDGDRMSWSKALREDGDIVILMSNNEEMSIPADDTGFGGEAWVDFNIDKNRDGRAGFTTQSLFLKETQKFVQSNE